MKKDTLCLLLEALFGIFIMSIFGFLLLIDTTYERVESEMVLLIKHNPDRQYKMAKKWGEWRVIRLGESK